MIGDVALELQTTEPAMELHLDQLPVLSSVTAILSNVVSNVPAVLMLKPFVAGLPDHDKSWLTIAMASTLAGNLTLLGSIANLIVVQRAEASGVTIRTSLHQESSALSGKNTGKHPF